MKTSILVFVCTLAVVIALTLGVSNTDAASLRGKAVDSQNKPLRGLSILLDSPISHIGTVGPVITTSEGLFFFPLVERRSDAAYDLKIYWGTKLLHSQKVLINTDIDLGPIRVK